MFILLFCFFNDTATTEIYTYLHTLSLHDALPILGKKDVAVPDVHAMHSTPNSASASMRRRYTATTGCPRSIARRSEEHTSELQSLMRISYAVFCLKKKNIHTIKKKNHKR